MKYFKIGLAVGLVFSLAACSNGNSVTPEDPLVDDCITSDCEDDVNSTPPTSEDSNQSIDDVPTVVDTSTADIPEGTRLPTVHDVEYNRIALPDLFRFKVSRVIGMGPLFVTASGPGYDERTFILSGEVVLNELLNALENDTWDKVGCSDQYSFYKFYINTDGPEMFDDFLTVTCEGGLHNTPKFDYHYVSKNGKFSMHGDLSPHSTALVSLTLHDLPITEGVFFIKLASIDSQGNETGLYYDEYLVDLQGRDHHSETYYVDLSDFAGGLINVRGLICHSGEFNNEGYCIDQHPVYIDQIATIALQH